VFRFRLLAIIAILLSACSTTATLPLNSPSETEAVVYLIRERAEPTAWNLGVYLDGAQVASLANNSYVAFSVPVGKKQLLLKWPPLAGKAQLETPIEFQPKQTRYLVVTGQVRLGGVSSAYQGTTLHWNESLQMIEVPSSIGEQLLGKLGKKS